jgi:hypothetical protein
VHVFVTEIPGGARKETRVQIAAGEKKRVELEVAAAATREPGVAPPPPTRGPDGEAPSSPAATSSQRTWALVPLGLGVVATGVGAVTVAMVFGRKTTIDAHCVDTACDATGKDAADDAKTLGTVSTISFAVAGGALVLGAILWLTAPRATSSATLSGLRGEF